MWTRKNRNFNVDCEAEEEAPLRREPECRWMSGIFTISLQQADPTMLMLQKCNHACFIGKFQNICYNNNTLFIDDLFLQYLACVGSHLGLISFLLKCKLDSLPSQTLSPRRELCYEHASERFSSVCCCERTPAKLTCRR